MRDAKDGNNTLTYVLPDVIDPPDTICVTLRIPNNRRHIEAFKGAIWDLCNWWNWERDDAKNGTKVAQVWRRVFRSMQFGNCNESIPPQGVLVEIDPMNGLFEVICDDTGCHAEFRCDICDPFIELATKADLASGQPGGGSPQPQPGGGSASGCYNFQANGMLLLQAPVNTGDTVTITGETGGGWDGGEINWRCPDGGVYFAGVCNHGATTLNPTDPIPTFPHMALILKIGTNYYPLTLNSPFTVPSGISAANATIQVNDSVLSDNAGSYYVCYTQTNNQTVNWTQVWHFADADGGWSNSDPFFGDAGAGTWIPGTGWSTADIATPAYRRIIELVRNFPSTVITSMDMEYSLTKDASYDGGTVGIEMYVGTNHVVNIPWGSAVDGTHVHQSWSGLYTVTNLGLQIQSSLYGSGGSPTFGGSAFLYTITVTGEGTNPFV